MAFSNMQIGCNRVQVFDPNKVLYTYQIQFLELQPIVLLMDPNQPLHALQEKKGIILLTLKSQVAIVMMEGGEVQG